MHFIKIGTLVDGGQIHRLPELAKMGFECFTITWWGGTDHYDFKESAKKVRDMMDETGCEISCLEYFGNPLKDQESITGWERVIDAAQDFGCSLVTGFAGRVPDISVDQSMPKYKEVYTPLNKRAMDQGVRIAFENCDMDGIWETGDYNIAMNPTAWEMMFNEIPSDNIGLEWEPCHQMVSLIDPIPQLRKWVNKVFHVHGKDATIAWDVIREYGIHGPKEYVWHRTPGFGDTNWADVCTILLQGGYEGTIDIEGFHDPVYVDNLEFTGQVEGMKYLKKCRGGEVYIENPK